MNNKFQISSLNELPFKKKVEKKGGRIYSVGGAVRDEFLGKESKDLDILITGIPMNELEILLSGFGKVNAVGKSFGILLFTPEGSKESIDIAIPRKEKSTGKGGHKGFDVVSDHTLSIETDLLRRDYSINAIAKDSNGNLIDPFGGEKDLKNKIIRVVNPDAFSDDPLRMLRGIGFASRFGFEIEQRTMELIKNNASRIKEISGERILEEFKKIITKKGDVLYAVDLLIESGLFKEIFGKNTSINRTLPWKEISTLGEFIFLLFQPITNTPSEIYKTTLKGDVDTQKEIMALNRAWLDNTDNVIKNRIVAHNMYKLFPQSFNSKILPSLIKNAIRDLKSTKYPLTLKELQVNGNDLLQIGLKGKEIGESLNLLLLKVYSDQIENKKEILLNSIKK